MARKPAEPSLVAEIDGLQARLEARLAEIVEDERAKAPTIPAGVHRNLLLRNSGNFFGAMRRLLSEREI